MTRILTVTLNPTLDVSTHTTEVVAGTKLRCAPPRLDPGGGGINVSRAIRKLGGDSTALVALGGATGRRLAELLEQDGIALATFSAPGESRENLAVTEDTTGRQFRFVLPGEDWDARTTARALDLIRHHAPHDGQVVISGSLPPGVAPDFLRQAVAEVAPIAAVLIDTSGAPLADLAAAPVPGLTTLRMDSDEAEDLAGGPLPERSHTADFAAGLVARGVAESVVVARGADGSVLATRHGRWHSAPPRVAVVSPVGAGDSFVAAHVLAIERGKAPQVALAHGTAAAAAAVMTDATELCRREDAERLVASCVTTAL